MDDMTESNNDSSGTHTCDGCGCMINGNHGSKWYCCTYCGDADFCFTCNQKDIHSKHKAYLQMFTVGTPFLIKMALSISVLYVKIFVFVSTVRQNFYM